MHEDDQDTPSKGGSGSGATTGNSSSSGSSSSCGIGSSSSGGGVVGSSSSSGTNNASTGTNPPIRILTKPKSPAAAILPTPLGVAPFSTMELDREKKVLILTTARGIGE